MWFHLPMPSTPTTNTTPQIHGPLIGDRVVTLARIAEIQAFARYVARLSAHAAKDERRGNPRDAEDIARHLQQQMHERTEPAGHTLGIAHNWLQLDPTLDTPPEEILSKASSAGMLPEPLAMLASAVEAIGLRAGVRRILASPAGREDWHRETLKLIQRRFGRHRRQLTGELASLRWAFVESAPTATLWSLVARHVAAANITAFRGDCAPLWLMPLSQAPASRKVIAA